MQLFEDSTPARIRAQLTWFLLWAGVTGFGIYQRPSHDGHGTHQQLGLPPCPSVLLFDRPCPGCGLTTSWTAFIHGNFVESFHAHPLGPFMYLGFTFVALACLYGNLKGKRFLIDSPRASTLSGSAIGIFFAFGLARMALVSGFSSPKEKMIRGFMEQPAAKRK